ncbi:hypothetical protein AGDE_08484 [Angomonas deanei]|nr:hypothetical protein AGDE_08484 [Angomonas deanei]|eukprot:EPY32841.1 hypothetical protein AGDE_08484 [Angomonas deanei]
MKNDFQSKIPYRYDENFSIEEFYRTNKKIKFPFYNKVGLVIDVNGTLLRGTEIVDESDVAIQKLNQLRIPFVLLCNHYMFVLELEAKLASSMTQTVFNTLEEKTAHLLSLLLRTTILADQIIFPFAPMKLLAEYYKGKNVLVVGNQRHKGFLPNRGDDSSSPLIKDILYQLGFTNVVSCLDYQCRHPELTPYKFYDQHMATSGGTSAPFEPISAIIQLSEPDDALNDAQTVLDVLLSVQNNPPGSPYNTVNHTVVVNEQLIPFYTVHDDVFTAHTFVLPRLSLEGGVFRNFIANLYNNITGNKLSCTTYGKPRHVLLAYAQARLEHLVTNGVFHTPGNQEGAMEHIFMVGDSIESDVVGANAMSYIQEEEGGPPASRVQWRSVYVMTGVGNNNFNTNDAQAVDSNVFTNYQYKYKEENKDDSELHFLDTHHNALSIPHYISPSFDHFLREFFAFPPEVFLEEKKKEDRGNHVPTLTLDLRSIYGWGSAP